MAPPQKFSRGIAALVGILTAEEIAFLLAGLRSDSLRLEQRCTAWYGGMFPGSMSINAFNSAIDHTPAMAGCLLGYIAWHRFSPKRPTIAQVHDTYGEIRIKLDAALGTKGGSFWITDHWDSLSREDAIHDAITTIEEEIAKQANRSGSDPALG
jgi:hypothetical protein